MNDSMPGVLPWSQRTGWPSELQVAAGTAATLHRVPGGRAIPGLTRDESLERCLGQGMRLADPG